jgi:hypothetical protein
MPRDQVFLSYSHKDAASLHQLETQLRVLEEHCGLEVWSDHRRLEVGDQWRQGIEAGLARARVAVLLVSPDFLASDFIRDNELPPLLTAAEREGARIVWVPLRPSLVEKTPIADFQAAWPADRPLSKLRKAQREEAWVDISRAILRAWKGEAASPFPIPAAPPEAPPPSGSAPSAASPVPSVPPAGSPAKAPEATPAESLPGPPNLLGSWVFGFLSLLFLAFAFFWPQPIAPQKWQIVRVVAAVMAGFFGVFLSGQLVVQLGHAASALGRVAARGTGGFALVLLIYTLWPAPAAEVYRLRVTVRAPDGALTTDAEVTVRPVGEVQKTASGWVVEVAAALLPADRSLFLVARAEKALPSEETVHLAEDFQPQVELRLREPPQAEVRGTVVDGKGQPVVGARVRVHGHDEVALSDAQGFFTIPARAPEGETVQLQVLADGYRPGNPFVPAGSRNAQVQLLTEAGAP